MSETQNIKLQSLDTDSILENHARAVNDTEIDKQTMDLIIQWINDYEFTEELDYSLFTQQLM